MKRDYPKKLNHLSAKDREELMEFYYGGMDAEILIEDYHVDLKDPKNLHYTFPQTIDKENRFCPHCRVPLLISSINTATFLQEIFCGECGKVLDELYNCRCEVCIQAKEDVIQIIQQAFKGVVLGAGIGLYEAQGLDDYVDDKDRAVLRKKDEHLDWKNIPSERLADCYSSLCFFDAGGMRFHLPAYIIEEIKNPGSSNANVILALTGPSTDEEGLKEYAIAQFILLNKKQRNAVKLFLQYCLAMPEYEFDFPAITKVLNEYWLV